MLEQTIGKNKEVATNGIGLGIDLNKKSLKLG
jgi:hypothetical protein